MKSLILGLLSALLFSFGVQGASINEIEAAVASQPNTCLTGTFSSTGDQYWKSITLKITNNCNTTVDLQDATITFQNKFPLDTSFWGDFSPLSYPDNDLRITSTPAGNGVFLSTLHLHFPTYSGATSLLSAGRSFSIKYGAPTDGFVQGTVKVYTGGEEVGVGSIQLTSASAKPANVTQNYALVHLTANGQNVTDVQLPWMGSKTISDLSPATYMLSAETVSDSSNGTYQGTVTPSTIVLGADQLAQATVSYAKVQQTGKLAIKLQALPTELAGYTGKPVVTLTGGGSTTSLTLNWNATATASELKSETSYSFSTPSITYKGKQYNPLFTPASLTAKTTVVPLTQLTYQAVQEAENMVRINVNGAPPSLSSLGLTLTPNSSSAVVKATIPLSNGTGSHTVALPNNVSYTVSAEAVSGYLLSVNPQPLLSLPNAILTIALSPTTPTGGTPTAVNGQLKVIGTQLCNEQNQPIQLKGMSSHGLQWYRGCLNTGSLNALANDFKASVLRISLYVQEDGYETNPTGFTTQVNQLIKEVSDRGMYALVDWHMLTPGDPNYNLERAKKFFTDIATANKGRKNLIYEIANEPNGVSWASVKSYAEKLIPVIRAIDPNTVILVGTPGWSSLGVSDGRNSQDIINARLNFPNIMYTFHFYAASHRDEYLNELDRASNVLPIFVTEFGTQTYSGDGANDFAMSDRYMDLMARKKISWTNWNYSDDFRSGAIWKEGTCPNGPWNDARLKPSGIYIKNKIKG